MASCFVFSFGSVCFQFVSIPAGAQSFFRFSSVVDAFHFLCGRFAVISLTLIILLHWFFVGAQVLQVYLAAHHSFDFLNVCRQ